MDGRRLGRVSRGGWRQRQSVAPYPGKDWGNYFLLLSSVSARCFLSVPRNSPDSQRPLTFLDARADTNTAFSTVHHRSRLSVSPASFLITQPKSPKTVLKYFHTLKDSAVDKCFLASGALFISGSIWSAPELKNTRMWQDAQSLHGFLSGGSPPRPLKPKASDQGRIKKLTCGHPISLF